MSLTKTPKRHRFPVSIMSQAVWLYHRFNHSFRDVQEQLAFRDVIEKRERKPCDKWHLDKMMIKINGELFVL